MLWTGVEVVPFPRPDESAANASHCPLAWKGAARAGLISRSREPQVCGRAGLRWTVLASHVTVRSRGSLARERYADG